ncbi:hypothetical protein KKF55_05495 [Patescibacteria group bacterium]|nr:hypothetical protein [Patescibacteria group bacterium]
MYATYGDIPEPVYGLIKTFERETAHKQCNLRMQEVRACRLGLMPKEQLASAINAADESLFTWWRISDKSYSDLFTSEEYLELYER